MVDKRLLNEKGKNLPVYDVLIVGGGPAGSTAARMLSRRGFHCLLLDKATFPRNKPCGGAISVHTYKNFPYIKDILGAASRGGKLYYGSPPMVLEETRDEIVAYYVLRVEFDKSLLDMTRQAGTEVREGVRISQIQIFNDKVTARAATGELFEGKFLIGADGVHSMVRRACGLERYWEKMRMAQAYVTEIEMDVGAIDRYFSSWYSTHLHLRFGHTSGYGWVFPKLHHVNIGFGEMLQGTTPKTVLLHYRDFLRHCQKFNLVPPLPEHAFHPLAWHVPMGGPMKHFTQQRVLLAGDAAGFVTPLMGEGIPYAMWSGYLGGYFISRALQGQCNDNEVGRLYEKSCWHAFGRELTMMAKMQTPLSKGLKTFFKLARYDENLRQVAEDLMLKGYNPWVGLPRMFKRFILGILHGNLWK